MDSCGNVDWGKKYRIRLFEYVLIPHVVPEQQGAELIFGDFAKCSYPSVCTPEPSQLTGAWNSCGTHNNPAPKNRKKMTDHEGTKEVRARPSDARAGGPPKEIDMMALVRLRCYFDRRILLVLG